MGGDRTQHVLWRIENGEIPLNLQVAFVHGGTNNLDRDNPAEIRDGIASIVYTIQEKKPNANIIVSGLLPRDQEISSRRDKIKLVNQKLMKWCQSGKVRNVHYLKPDRDWTDPDGRLVERYYFSDFLHLVEEGYEKFAKSIYEAIVKVSQGNAVNLVKDRKRPRSKSGSTTPSKTQQNQNGQTTSMTFTTTVLPKPKLTATVPPPTAIALKLKIPPTVTSTLIPTIPPITTSLCDWFVDSKLSVHFGEEKTKSILFETKRQLKNQRDLDLRYGDIEIKQHSRVTYLGCILDNDLSGEFMATKVLN